MFVQLSRSVSTMFTRVHRYNSADINRSLPRPAGQRSAFEGPQVSYLIRCIVYRGSGLILLQIVSARIIHSTERNLCKVRLQTSLAFACLALLHLQKFGRKIFRKGSGMTYLERGYVRYLCQVHLGEETNYGLLWCTPCFARFTHKLLQGIALCPRNCSDAPLLVGNADTGDKHGKIGYDFS